MLRLIPDNTTFDFIGKRRIFVTISLLLLVASLVLVVVRGLNYGIDFAGGTLVQIQTPAPTEVGQLRTALANEDLAGLTIQQYGADDEFLIRVPGGEEGDNSDVAAEEVATALAPVVGEVEIRRVEFVGPQIGEELRKKGLLALLLSLGAILIYISMRFELRYGIGAIAALAHDVFLTVGVFSLLQKEVTLTVLAALLTIIGYSLNDTIVVFDRVRENRRKYRKRPIADVLNMSVNDMLGRTVMTSLTTLIVLIALYTLGGGVINDFAFTLIFGVLIGTYSSVFIAAPVVLGMEKYYINRPEDDAANNKDVVKE